MANSKISALTAATTPVAGTEVLPIVQSGATVKVAVSDLTAGRSVSMASATISSGNITFTGAGSRITGDFSNATVANRVIFQTSTVDSSTVVISIPNGTGTTGAFVGYNNSDPTNASFASVQANSGDVRYQSGISGTGTYLPMTFYTGGNERIRIIGGTGSDVGNVGIRVTAPTVTLHVAGPTQNTDIAVFTGGGNFTRGLKISTFAAVNNDAGVLLNAQTTTNGVLAFATAGSERMRITSAGNVLVTFAAGLGYGTGSGGTVTQATSRTTGVTLSKPTGAITMFSAAGSVVAATFTVTNSLVAATDTIILNQQSGTNLYILLVTAVAAGSFNITFYTTGGVATDAPVINFSLIKGVTA